MVEAERSRQENLEEMREELGSGCKINSFKDFLFAGMFSLLSRSTVAI